MEDLLAALRVVLFYGGNWFLAFVLGWFLTEVITLPIRVKPFNCRPCLTFWLTFLGGTLIALTLSFPWVGTAFRVVLIVQSFLMGLVSFFYLKSLFKIHE